MKPIKSPTVINGKYSLLWLLNYYQLNMISLAHKSGVEIKEVHKMVKGEAVEKDVAERVLAEFSRIAGIKYTLKDVYINIKEKGNENTTT